MADANRQWDPEKMKLKDLSKRVHNELRVLKMGQTGTIAVSELNSATDITNYVWAYSFHKRKWFETKFDKTKNVIYATRKPPPPWEKEKEDDDWEEV